jgi:hypothetical protein
MGALTAAEETVARGLDWAAGGHSQASGKELWVVLRDVREFGIVYTMVGIPQPIFSPWSSIVWMTPLGEDTQAFEVPEQEGS